MAGTSAVTDPTVTLPDPTRTALEGTGASAVGKEDFLRLLVAQLTHQDPLNPMQGTEFTAQLAQFSALEQLININKALGKLASLETAFSQSQAVGMLGKQILAQGNTITISDGTASNIIFSLGAASDQTLVSVFDRQGGLVSVIDAGARAAGQHNLAFPARNAQGLALPDGVYTFRVQATAADGKEVSAQTFASGIVSGVKVAQGATLLTVGPTEIPLSSVVQITEPKPVPPESPAADPGGSGT